MVLLRLALNHLAVWGTEVFSCFSITFYKRKVFIFLFLLCFLAKPLAGVYFGKKGWGQGDLFVTEFNHSLGVFLWVG